jgi:hypothetical protein
VQEPDTNETGQDGRGTFLAGSGDTPPETGVRRGARAQGGEPVRRRWRLRTRVLVAAGVAVAAAGVTAASLAASASPAPSPLAVLTGALAKTTAGSYHFGLTSEVLFRGRDMHSDAVSGAYDPQRQAGTEELSTQESGHLVTGRFRFLGKYVYTQVTGSGSIAKPWDKSPVPAGGVANDVPGYDGYGFISDQPVSPAELSGVLRSASTVRAAGPASGPGWTGTRYTFITRLYAARITISGTVYVDQQGLVRRVVTTTTQVHAVKDRDLTLSDFGAPVPVAAPPASQVEYTGNPYWGFYF